MGSAKKILVIDDDPVMVFEIVSVVEEYFPEVEIDGANSSEEALVLFKQNLYELVITDIKMPGLSGLDLITLLHRSNTKIEFIVMSGEYNILQEFDKLLINRIVPHKFLFLAKPFQNEELYYSIRKSLFKIKVETENLELLTNLQKMADVGDLVSEIVHDLKGLISAVKMTTEQLIAPSVELLEGDKATKEDINQSCDEIIETSDTMLEFVESILSMNRKDEGFRAIQVKEIFSKAIMPLQNRMHKTGISCTTKFANSVPVKANNKIIRVFLNLIKNAMEALADKTDAAIDIEAIESENHTIIKVKDNGTGIPPDVLSKLRRNIQVSTKGQHGNGLGLKGARKIIEEFGGKFEIDSVLGEEPSSS
ncbi:MAG: response regulator [Deltaproteobacteria bacterium]|nr:response regulator [Deltaproteobacteria bacterium]